MKKQLFSFLLLLLLFTNLSAQSNSKPSKEQERLRNHVTYLASEQLEGRKTGETGATYAAGYVSNIFAQLKLKTAGNAASKSYMQTFPFVTALTLGEGNLLEFKSKESGKKIFLKLKEEWLPLSFSANERLENLTLVDVGYGITAKNLNYDDYRGIDLKNSIAFAVDGSPDKKLDQYADLRRKALAAREAGAKALMILTDINQDKFTKLEYENLGDAGLPVFLVSDEGINKTVELMLPKSGVGLRSSDGTDISYRGDTSVTTKADGTRIVTKKDGTTYTYKIEKKTEGNATYYEKLDERTIIKNPDGTTIELENDFMSYESLGEKQEDFTVSLSVDLIRKNAEAYNVVGVLEGRDAALKNEAIVIGAHYDHLGRGGRSSLDPNSKDIHFGADDNASGVAAMLELARYFSKEKNNKRTLIFIAFGAEEQGLIGSKAYVNNPVFPLDKTVAMINMDMVGRLNADKLTVGGIGSASEWSGLVNQKNALEIVKLGTPNIGGNVSSIAVSKFNLQLNQDGFGPSDHSSFYGKQIPVLFFFTGTHADYHKPSDTAEKINYQGLEKIMNYVGEIVTAIDRNPKRPTYTNAPSSGMMGGRSGGSFNVSLGTVPGYAENTNDGLALDGVRDGSPAAKAGVKAGDKIVKLAGRDVKNITDYVFVLGEMKANTEYEIVVMRGAEKLTLKITPEARK